MENKYLSLDFGIALLHNHVLNGPVLYYFLSIIFIILFSSQAAAWLHPRRYLTVPLYGLDENDKDAPKKRWMRDSINLVQEGYQKFKDKPFQLWTTEGNQVFLPPKLIDELKMLQDDILPSTLFEIMQCEHTTFGGGDKHDASYDGLLLLALKQNLNKNIPLMLPQMKEELEFGISAEFPPCNDWEAVLVSQKMARLVSRVSGRAFVGASISHEEAWIDLSVTYTRDIFEAAMKIRHKRPSLRRIAKYFIPEIRRIHSHNAVAIALIGNVLKQRVRDEKEEGYIKPIDALEWVRDALPEKKQKDIRFQTLTALSLVAAAINTTSYLITNTIFDLAVRPEYIEMLREEAIQVLDESNGHWTADALSKLKKMDSFVKETQRQNSLVTSFTRKTAKDLTLSDGTFLPKNTYLLAPALAISADSTIYPNADIFDGLRFYNLRQQSPQNEHMYQLTTTDKHMLHFGAGRHACPGRWFAAAEVKLILANLILQYDMKMKDGIRPKGISFQNVFAPNPMVPVLFKRREI